MKTVVHLDVIANKGNILDTCQQAKIKEIKIKKITSFALINGFYFTSSTQMSTCNMFKHEKMRDSSLFSSLTFNSLQNHTWTCCQEKLLSENTTLCLKIQRASFAVNN